MSYDGISANSYYFDEYTTWSSSDTSADDNTYVWIYDPYSYKHSYNIIKKEDTKPHLLEDELFEI